MRVAENGSQDSQATSEDVRRALGEVDDHVVVEVLSARPSLGDLAMAALWVRGDGDLEARNPQTLSARAQAIVQLMIRLKEEELNVDAP